MQFSQVDLNGMIFNYRKDDRYIGQRIALQKYERYETAILLSQINKNSVVVDVGANIGYYTLLTAKVAKKVYAIEPDKEAFEILKKNIEENNLKNVILFNKAVGSKNEIKYLTKDKENLGNCKIVESQKSKSLKVECVRLDEVIKEKVDLIKIDVQGYELEVLKGMGKMEMPIMFLEIDQKNIKSLKLKYKYIWSINDFAETPWPIYKGIQIKNNNGYVDLWLKNKMNFSDFWTMLINVNYKKWIKGWLFK